MNSKFSYGDAVIIKRDAPSFLHPGGFGSICSLRQVTSEQEAEKLKCQVGEWVYTVEFENGSDIQIAECYLDKDSSIINGRELSEYSSYFVNGFVSDINIKVTCFEIKIKSAPIKQNLFTKELIIIDGIFRGKLIASQIKEIIIRNKKSPPVEWLEKGTVLEFEISDDLFNLLVEWEKGKTTLFHIKSDQIWWEQRDT